MAESGIQVAVAGERGLRPERRAGGIDRRERLFSSLLYGGLNPRRRTGRRAADHHRPIVDWHGPWLFLSAMLILVLCVADGLLTLRLLDAGAIEANPFMASVVYDNARRFAILKLALTGAGVLTLVSLASFRVFRVLRASVFLHAILIAYVVLVSYELLLLDRLG
jgi:hypothetical protein